MMFGESKLYARKSVITNENIVQTYNYMIIIA